jgi:hypothetical protein
MKIILWNYGRRIKMLKHYVNFDEPGSFMPETMTRMVNTRIPARLKNIPKYTYAIDYFDREEIRQNNEILKGNAKNKSTRIVFGKIYTKSDLLKEGFTTHDPLYHNADNSGCDGKVIKCITGNWQPWYKEWIILNSYEDLKALKEAI